MVPGRVNVVLDMTFFNINLVWSILIRGANGLTDRMGIRVGAQYRHIHKHDKWMNKQTNDGWVDGYINAANNPLIIIME